MSDKAEDGKAREVPGEGRSGGGNQVDAKRDEEEAFASPTIREPPKVQRAEDGTGQAEQGGQRQRFQPSTRHACLLAVSGRKLTSRAESHQVQISNP